MAVMSCTNLSGYPASGTKLAAGAAIGGAVTAAFGREASSIIDALSFLVCAWLLARMRGRFSERVREERPPFLESIRETIRFARREPRVLALLTVKGGYGLAARVVTMLGVFGREVFRDARYRAIAWCVLSFGVGYAALALSKTLAIGFLAILFAHLGDGAADLDVRIAA